MEVDLGKELGAAEESFSQRLTLYIPNKDQDDNEIEDHDEWIKEARRLLSKIGGGTTALPAADGTWVDEHGNVVWETTKIVYCYILPTEFRKRVREVREFTHRFGRETKQGEVVSSLMGSFTESTNSTERQGRTND